jgi:hypothetical protein
MDAGLESGPRRPECQADAVEPFSDGAIRGIRMRGRCGAATIVRGCALRREPDAIDVRVTYTPAAPGSLQAVEDRFDFLPNAVRCCRAVERAPDFIWSQNIKARPIR